MSSVTLEEAALHLPELVKNARESGDIVLTQDNEPVAKIVALPRRRAARRPGSAKGIILHIADDFDATPEGFEEYMP
jgi:antitoxin (DNA-binding transcriptional repressor) of toxin-antitoxin stability system